MIPKILHTIWLGNEKSKYDYRDRWIKLHPDWSYIHWTESVIQSCYWAQDSKYKNFKDYVSQSDYLRLFILYYWGGVYVDMDVEPLKSFNSLIEQDFFIGREDERYLCPAVMGSRPGHNLLYDCLYIANHTMKVPWGPKLITEQVKKYPDIKIYSPEYFFPYHWTQLGSIGYPEKNSYCIHHWNATRNGFK